MFFGFAGAWGDAGNLPFTITFSDAARLVRRCVEVDLASLPVRQHIGFDFVYNLVARCISIRHWEYNSQS